MSATQYTRDWVVETLHKFPHVNFSFELTSSKFADTGSYKESILFLAAVPVVWCLLVLLLMSICLCVQCCRKKPQKRKSTLGLRCVNALFIILAVGSVAVGFFGNEESNKGVQSTVDAIQDTNQTVQEALGTLETIDQLTVNITGRGLTVLNEILKSSLVNKTARKEVLHLSGIIDSKSVQIREDIKTIRSEAAEISFDYIADATQNVERYRWIGTIVLFCWQIVVLLLYIVGTLKKSKCWLMWAIIFGYISLFLVWVATGVYLGGSVGVSDFCYDPGSYIVNQSQDAVTKEIIRSYIECKDKTDPQNFSVTVNDAVTTVQSANNTLTEVVNKTLKYNITAKISGPVDFIRKELAYAQSNITILGEAVYCTHIHTNYVKSLNGLCSRAIVGVALILLIMPILGFSLIFVQCLAPRIWLLFGKKKGYAPVDHSDPFLPRPPPYHGYGSTSISQPEDRPTSLHEASVMDEPMFHAEGHRQDSPDDSPPPAYYPGSFVEQYNNLRPTLGTFPRNSNKT